MKTKNGYFIKDLRVMKNRSLSRMVIVDKSIQSFGFQISNGIPIVEWTGNKYDTELLHLKDFLIKLSTSEDIQKTLSEKLKLQDMLHYDVQELIRSN